ncbi:MAG: hypothetical protein R6U89_05715 [Dehalococcoidia bacterium]
MCQKNRFRQYALLVVTLLLFSATGCTGTNPSPTVPEETVSEVEGFLQTYKHAVETGDIQAIAAHHAPPMDKQIRANGEWINASQELKRTIEERWGDTAPADIGLKGLGINPYLSTDTWNYSDLQIEDNIATVSIEQSGAPGPEKYEQRIARIEGEWSFVDLEGPIPYSKERKKTLTEYITAISKYTDSITDLANDIEAGRIEQEHVMPAIERIHTEYIQDCPDLGPSPISPEL